MTRSQEIIISRIADIADPGFLASIATLLAKYDTEKIYMYAVNSKSEGIYYEVSSKFRGFKRNIARSVDKKKAEKIKEYYEIHGNLVGLVL